jgi:hypothetical protein
MGTFGNSGAFQYGVIVAFLFVVVILSGSATAQPAIPIADAKALAGKWVGTATSPRVNSPYELTVHEDGTWNSVVPNIPPGKFTGTLQVTKGKATAHSDTSKITYDVTLSEREGKQALQLTSDLLKGGRILIDLTRAP